ncbi:hypothetical protein TorRG33x02_315730, partial [Trema orientale]
QYGTSPILGQTSGLKFRTSFINLGQAGGRKPKKKEDFRAGRIRKWNEYINSEEGQAAGKDSSWSESSSENFESDPEALEVQDENPLIVREEGKEAGLEGLRLLKGNSETGDGEDVENVQKKGIDETAKVISEKVDNKISLHYEDVRIGKASFTWAELQEALNSSNVEIIPKEMEVKKKEGGGGGTVR